jgi:hypothetical protein
LNALRLVRVRRTTTWIIVSALLIVGLAAGVDALRHNDNPPPAQASANRVSTTEATTTTSAVPAAPLSGKLVIGQVVKLRTGSISTELLGMKVSFEVFGGYGYQADETGFVVGDRSDGLRQRTGLDFGVGVNGIELPLERAATQLERTPGVRVLSVDKGEIFDHPARPYPRLGGHRSHLYRPFVSRSGLAHIFGIPAQSFSRPQSEGLEQPAYVVLVGASDKTFLIRFGRQRGADTANLVLMSLRFPRWSDEIVPPFGVSKADVYSKSRQVCAVSSPEAVAQDPTTDSVSAAHAYARRRYHAVLRRPAFEGCLDGFE